MSKLGGDGGGKRMKWRNTNVIEGVISKNK